jgi:hypothetical protein
MSVNNELAIANLNDDSPDYELIYIDSNIVFEPLNLKGFAFKRNRDHIYYGDKPQLAKFLLSIVHEMKNDLELYFEVLLFSRSADIAQEEIELILVNGISELERSNMEEEIKFTYAQAKGDERIDFRLMHSAEPSKNAVYYQNVFSESDLNLRKEKQEKSIQLYSKRREQILKLLKSKL